MSLEYLTVPEHKEMLKHTHTNTYTVMGLSQRDIRVN